MKLISWNVNGIRACLQKGFWSFIQKEAPDIFCLQETKAFRDQCKELWPELIAFEGEWHSAQKPGYSGVASFYKTKPLKVLKGMGSRDLEGRVLVKEWDQFFLVNAYVPNGAASDERHDFKMKFLDEFLSFLKSLDSVKPLILCGDINIAHREIDIHDPVRLDGASGFKPEERKWMDDLFSQGFVDAYRMLHPTQVDAYSWWSYRAGARQRNKGWRIDYFILSERLESKIKKLRMEKHVLGSDHCPVILEVDF
jgi:exodeoxyribonuclease-3